MSVHAVRHEFGVKLVKLVGGGVTYAASKEGAQTVLEHTQAVVDPSLITQWAGAFAAVMTGLYFLGNFGYIMWKWRKEAKGG